MNTILLQSLKNCLADVFTFYLKAHFYHWNVVGQDFMQYHELFAKIYEQAFAEVDTIAELIRTLDDVAPGSMARFKELTKIQEADSVPDIRSMVMQLLSDNDVVLSCLYITYKTAEDTGEIGVSNAIQNMITDHQKLSWFLRASSK